MITKILYLTLIALLVTATASQQVKAIEGGGAPWNYTKYANLPSPSPLKSMFSEGITIQVISDPWVIYQFEDQSIGLYLQECGHNLNRLTPIQTQTDFKDLKEALAFIGLEVK